MPPLHPLDVAAQLALFGRKSLAGGRCPGKGRGEARGGLEGGEEGEVWGWGAWGLGKGRALVAASSSAR